MTCFSIVASATFAGNAADESVQCVADPFQSASHDQSHPHPTIFLRLA